MKKKVILIYGPQGSGKSTQARLLADYIGYKFISTGELLRNLRSEKNPIGLKLSKYWEKGELVPDELIEEDILFPLLEKEEALGFVIDGYPRNINQLRSFESFLNLKGWEIEKILFIDVGKEECLKRLKLRVNLEERPDETDDAIQKRLDIYYEKTEPLLKEFEATGKLRKTNGERTIEEIQSDLQSLVRSTPT